MSRSRAREGVVFSPIGEDTNDYDLLVDVLSVDKMHEESVRTTEKEEINYELRTEYRNRIKRIYICFMAEYPD